MFAVICVPFGRLLPLVTLSSLTVTGYPSIAFGNLTIL